MPSNFENDFVDDDVIEVSHVKQYGDPINDLESGKAFYRVASGGTGAPYIVDFQADADPTVRKHHLTTDTFTPIEDRNELQPGQVVVFKADVSSPANASLRLVLEDGASGTNSADIPLNAGGGQVGLDDILQDQIVVAIYNDAGGGRFDVAAGVEGPAGAQGPEGPNGSISILTDVGLPNAMADGQLLQYNNTNSQFENVSRSVNTTAPLTGGGDLSQDRTVSMPAADGVSQDGYLTSAKFAEFDAKQDALTGSGDVPGLTAELAAKQDTLAGSGDVPGLTAELAAKQDNLAGINDVPGLDVNTPADGQILQYDSASGDFQNQTRSINTTGPLSGGGDLSQDRTISIPVADGVGQDGYLTSAKFAEFDGKQDVLAGSGDVPGLTAELAAKQDTLTGSGDVPGLTAELAAKQDNLVSVNDVPGIDVNAPADGQILQYDSTSGDFQNQARSINTAAPLSGGGDLSQDRTLSMPAADGVGQDGFLSSAKFAEFDGKQDVLTGSGDVPGLTTELAAKQDQDAALDEISGLTMAKGDIMVHNGTSVQNLGAGTDGQVLQANSVAGAGVEWADASAGGASQLDELSDVGLPSALADGQVLQYNNTNSQFENRGLSAAGIASSGDVSNLQTQIDGKEDASDKGQAGGYAGLDGTSGAVPIDQGGTNATTAASARANLDAQQQSGLLDDIAGLAVAPGDILYVDGSSNLVRLPKGTALQELRMNSGATAPEWQDVPALPSNDAPFANFDRNSQIYLGSSTYITFVSYSATGNISLYSNQGVTIDEDGVYLVSWRMNGYYYSGSSYDVTTFININYSNQTYGKGAAFTATSNVEGRPNFSGSATFSLSDGDVVRLYHNPGLVNWYCQNASMTITKVGN